MGLFPHPHPRKVWNAIDDGPEFCDTLEVIARRSDSQVRPRGPCVAGFRSPFRETGHQNPWDTTGSFSVCGAHFNKNCEAPRQMPRWSPFPGGVEADLVQCRRCPSQVPRRATGVRTICQFPYESLRSVGAASSPCLVPPSSASPTPSHSTRLPMWPSSRHPWPSQVGRGTQGFPLENAAARICREAAL